MKNRRGVLLLEALLTTVVVGAGLVALIQAASASLRAEARAEDMYRAGLMLEEKVQELARDPAARAEGVVEREDPAWGTLRWETAMREPEDPEAPWRSWTVTLTRGRDGFSLSLSRVMERA